MVYEIFEKLFRRKYQPALECGRRSLLGIKYNATTNQFSWVDGSNLTFSMFMFDETPDVDLAVYHYVSGSNWHVQSENELDSRIGICQLRLKTDDAVNDTLHYPTSNCIIILL